MGTDCRPEFVEAFERSLNLGTKSARFKIHTPLIRMTKADIIREGRRLGIDLATTHSCYDPGKNGDPCDLCDACALRARGFEEADARVICD